MKKSIQWRINHAERKMAEGKKLYKFRNMLDTFKRMRKTEISEGIKFVYGINGYKKYSK